jgi:anti-sigma factor RsiW
MNNVDENMQNPEFNQLIDAAWRRSLTPEEQGRLRRYLAGHPLARAQCDEEVALTRTLNRLAPAPISSNFTARVMQAVERAPARRTWLRRLDLDAWLPAGWMPRLALGAAMVCVSLLTIREYQDIQRKQMARDLASVSRLAALPPVDWLRNFDTIDRLNRVKVADEDLLSALQ